MQNRKITPIVGLMALVLALGACSGVKKSLGIGKQAAPDEFRVVSRAPLSLPPEFTLRPPAPGEVRPQEGTATQQARSAVFRENDNADKTLDEAVPDDGRSRGERALLFAAGADKTDSAIRQAIDQETAQINDDSQDFVDTLVFWREAEKPGVIVDPTAEARRIRENSALGRSPTSGRTPTIERKKKAILEDLF